MKTVISSNQESYQSLLLISSKGKLKRVYCPFKAICIKAEGAFRVNSWVYVEAVIPHAEYAIAYLIMGNYYPYSSFYLPLNY